MVLIVFMMVFLWVNSCAMKTAIRSAKFCWIDSFSFFSKMLSSDDSIYTTFSTGSAVNADLEYKNIALRVDFSKSVGESDARSVEIVSRPTFCISIMSRCPSLQYFTDDLSMMLLFCSKLPLSPSIKIVDCAMISEPFIFDTHLMSGIKVAPENIPRTAVIFCASSSA